MERKIKCYALPLLAVLGAAVLGGYFIDVYSPWYQSLRLPAFMPEWYVFAFAWTAVYAFLYAAMVRDCLFGRRNQMYLYGLNLSLNALWPFAFFYTQSPAFGLLVIVLLLLTVLILIRKSDGINRLLLAPYFLWGMVALALNYAIVVMN